MLTIHNLHAGYNEINVLKGVSIHVGNKEVVALIGPNGAGKSTVIKSVFGLTTITRGSITFNGKNMRSLKTHELLKEGIAYVNQGRVVFQNLSVKENLAIGGLLIKDKKKLEEKKNSLFKKFPILKERRSELAYTLSGGERQQLALARALMHAPQLILLDEPSLGLSPKLVGELFKTIAHLKDEGISFLIVEQNAKKAIELADRTYVLEDGSIALEGGKEIIKNSKIKEVYLGGRY